MRKSVDLWHELAIHIFLNVYSLQNSKFLQDSDIKTLISIFAINFSSICLHTDGVRKEPIAYLCT